MHFSLKDNHRVKMNLMYPAYVLALNNGVYKDPKGSIHDSTTLGYTPISYYSKRAKFYFSVGQCAIFDILCIIGEFFFPLSPNSVLFIEN